MLFDMKTTKTEKAVSYFQKGLYKECFAIVSTFKLGFDKKEIRIIQIAKECLTGNSAFYLQLGIDVNGVVNDAIKLVERKYNITNNI